MCRLYGKFASYLRRVLCKTRLIFPRINGPIVAKTRSRMTTAITFSRQKDTGSRAHHLKNLALIVVLVLESKGLYCNRYQRQSSGAVPAVLDHIQLRIIPRCHSWLYTWMERGITGVVENKGRFPKVRTGQSEGHFEGNRSSRTKVILQETRIMQPEKLNYITRRFIRCTTQTQRRLCVWCKDVVEHDEISGDITHWLLSIFGDLTKGFGWHNFGRDYFRAPWH